MEGREGREGVLGLWMGYRFIRVTEIIDAAGLLEETAIFTATYLKDLNYRHKQLYLAGLRAQENSRRIFDDRKKDNCRCVISQRKNYNIVIIEILVMQKDPGKIHNS